jgi:holin-like protein
VRIMKQGKKLQSKGESFLKLWKICFIFLQLGILFLLNKIGGIIVEITNLPIPGNVMGMVLLFLLLCTRIIRLEWVEEVSTFLIKHLSFFFIPISVGLMTLLPVFIKSGVALIIVLVVSTLVGIIVSGFLSQTLVMRKEALHREQHHHHL